MGGVSIEHKNQLQSPTANTVRTPRADTTHSGSSFGVLCDMGSLNQESREMVADQEGEETRAHQGGNPEHGGATHTAPQTPNPGGNTAARVVRSLGMGGPVNEEA